MSTESSAKPPALFSLEAEQAVLGSLILDKHAWDRIADDLLVDDFYQPAHKMIYQAMLQLLQRNQPIDCLTLAEALKSQKQLAKCGGEAYLYELANHIPSAGNVKAYADIVHEHATLSRLVCTAGEISNLAFNPDGRDSKTLVDHAEKLIFDISEKRTRGSGPVDIATLLARTTDQVDTLYRNGRQVTGIQTGFTDLDNMTSGLQRGDLVIVAGRPSMGKTCLAMNLAESAAIEEALPVLVFSLEMPAESITMRLLSSLGRIDQHKLRSGALSDNDWPRISSAVSMLSQTKIFIDDTPALTPMEVRTRARRIAREHGQLGLIVIDYLQFMTGSGKNENRTTEISGISRSLKALAKELNVPVVAGSQLNRGLEQRPDKRPVMSDLRESGAIEQDADLIAFIYRDEVYHPDSPYKGSAEIIIGKQRNGPIGKIRLTFMGKYTRFENYVANNPMLDIPGPPS